MKIGIWRDGTDFEFEVLNNYYDIEYKDSTEIDDVKINIPKINIVLSKTYGEKDYVLDNTILAKEDKVLIHIYMKFNNILILPIRKSLSDTCCDCVYHALRNNRNKELIEGGEEICSGKLDFFSNEIFEMVLMDILEKLKNNQDILNGEMIKISLGNMIISTHKVMQNEFCRCAASDIIEEDRYDFETEEICANDSLRIKEDLDIAKIKDDIYDPLTGLVANIYKDMNSKFLPMVCVEFNSSKGTIVNGSYGRSSTYLSTEKSAILEVLERYSNMWPKGNIERIRACYKEVKDEAINPRKFILNDKSLSKMSNDKFKEYSDELPIDWVYGYSIKKKSKVLLPEQIVYFDIDEVRGNVNRFIFETSNGAALGGSIQEAVLYGLFEVIERDAFLITWYNKLSLNRIDIESIEDEKVKKCIQYVQNACYDLYLFDSTMENRIPSVICIAVNRDENTLVNSYLAAGCHINPVKAIESALVEVISSIPVYEKSFKGREEEAKELYKNPDKVLKMDDHVLLYSLKETLEKYDFLLNSKVTKSIDELYPEWIEFKNEKSITKILSYVISKVTEYNDDVLVVNCANKLIDSYGLYAVKVLVSGMLSMTFGQQNKRINEKRVKEIPVLCKFREREIEKLNLYPHSFP